MSSETPEQKNPDKAASPQPPAGLGLSLRLALIYAALFCLGAVVLFSLTWYLLATTLEQREVDAVKDRVREYRAWYMEGGLGALNSRFAEQSSSTSDILFLRVTGPGVNALFYSNPRATDFLKPEALRSLDPQTTGPGVHLGGSEQDDGARWTVVSAELPGGAMLQAGRSSLYLDQVLSRFRYNFMLVLLPALLLGVALSTAVAFRGLQPIRRLIHTMQGILDTGDLQRRAPLAKSPNELNKLSELFNRLLERNQRLIETTRESLDAVAHDLRTPMTRLRNVAEKSIEQAGDLAAAREALETCLEESDNALTLLRSLTEIAEAETGTLRLNLETVRVTDIATHVASLYEFVAEERNITLHTSSISPTLAVRADRPRLQQILANLVDNAIKYAPDNTTVTLSAAPKPGSEAGQNKSGSGPSRSGSGPSHPGMITVSVADEGPGIPEADLPRIWERLYRGDTSRCSSKPGLGLGLSLVRAVTEAHGGTATVEAAAGQGTTFTLTLPAAAAASSNFQPPISK